MIEYNSNKGNSRQPHRGEAVAMRLKREHLLALASFFVVLVALLLLQGCGSADNQMTAESIRGGETRGTLSPAHFVGPAAKAYRVAKEIPEILDSLHCYCECKKNFGHKSLLTCYVDRHAEHCGVCIDEALMAYKLHKEGKDVVSIRKAVDKAFARN
jgi:hypothetical protein